MERASHTPTKQETPHNEENEDGNGVGESVYAIKTRDWEMELDE